MPLRALLASVIIIVVSAGAQAVAEADDAPAAASETLAIAAEAPESVSTAVVEELHVEILDVMKHADELGYDGRYRAFDPVLGKLFDTSFMAEKSVGRHWKKMDDAEKAELRETFRRFTVANYAGRFDGYSGQHFETLGEEPSTHGTVLVQTRLVDPDGENVQLNYRLHETESGWKIFDVYLNGTVSELALRRSEYSSLISREGLPALIVALGDKIDKLSTGAAPDTP